MSQLSKREEVWLKVYAVYAGNDSSQPDMMADIALKRFDDRFPRVLDIKLSDEEIKEYESIKSKLNVESGKSWGLNTENKFESNINLQDAARQLTKFLIEKEEKEILEIVGKFSLNALERLKRAVDFVCMERIKLHEKLSKEIENFQ